MNIPLTNRSQITILPMASSCGLCAHPGTFFVKILEQMSVVTLWIIFWAQLQKALCFLMLLSRTISTLTFFPANSTKERKEQVRIMKPNAFIPGPCLRNEEGGWGRASILSVMPNAAPNRPWCWEGLVAGGEGDDRGWDGWMVSPTQWTWVWVNWSWWWTGRPGVLQFMGSQRVGHNWATELNWTEWWRKATYTTTRLLCQFYTFIFLQFYNPAMI